MSSLPTILWVTAGLAISALSSQLLMQAIIRYRIAPPYFEVALFGVIPIWRCRIGDLEVELTTLLRHLANPDGYYKYLGMVNKLSWCYVLIHRPSGFFRHVIISPWKPDDFIKALLANGAVLRHNGVAGGSAGKGPPPSSSS